MKKIIIACLSLIVFILSSSQAQTDGFNEFIASGVQSSFSESSRSFGKEIEQRDTIPYEALGAEIKVPRWRKVSIWLFPKQERAAFQYVEYIYDAYEIPVRKNVFGMAEADGKILWTVDSADWIFLMDKTGYHPENDYLKLTADVVLATREIQHCLVSPDGSIVHMEEDLYSLGTSTDNSVMVTMNHVKGSQNKLYRLYYRDYANNQQWERYYSSDKAFIKAIHYGGKNVLIAQRDTLFCLNNQGNIIWKKIVAGADMMPVKSSTFNTFLCYRATDGMVFILGPEMKDTLATFAPSDYSATGAFLYEICMTPGSDYYGLFPAEGKMTFRLSFIDEHQKVIDGGLKTISNKGGDASFSMIYDTSGMGVKVYYAKELVYQMEGRQDGTEKNYKEHSD